MILSDRELYTTEEIAEILKLKVSSIQRLLREGKLKGKMVGGQYRIKGADVYRYLGLDLSPEPQPEIPGTIRVEKEARVTFTPESKQAGFQIKRKAELLSSGWLRVMDLDGEWVYYSPAIIVTIH